METQGVTKTDRFKAKSRETHPNIVRAHGNERRVKFVSNDIQDMGSADLRIGQSSHVYVVIHGSFLLCLAEYATSDECCHHVMLLLDRRSDVLQYPSIKETVEIHLLLWLTIRPSLRRGRSVRLHRDRTKFLTAVVPSVDRAKRITEFLRVHPGDSINTVQRLAFLPLLFAPIQNQLLRRENFLTIADSRKCRNL